MPFCHGIKFQYWKSAGNRTLCVEGSYGIGMGLSAANPDMVLVPLIPLCSVVQRCFLFLTHLFRGYIVLAVRNERGMNLELQGLQRYHNCDLVTLVNREWKLELCS